MLPVAHSLPPNWHSRALLLASSPDPDSERGHKAHPQTPLGATSIGEFWDPRMFKNRQACCDLAKDSEPCGLTF